MALARGGAALHPNLRDLPPIARAGSNALSNRKLANIEIAVPEDLRN